MRKANYRSQLNNLLHEAIKEHGFEGARGIMENAFVDAAKDEKWDTSKRGDEWTDEELAVVLSSPPSKLNCLRHAIAFKRGFGSIEQIYRWTSATEAEIKKKGRDRDKFVLQVKRVAGLLGWRV